MKKIAFLCFILSFALVGCGSKIVRNYYVIADHNSAVILKATVDSIHGDEKAGAESQLETGLDVSLVPAF